MTYEEMVERAQRMRSRDIFGAVPREEIDAVGARQTELQLPVSEQHTVHVYQLEPRNGRPENCPLIINFHGGGFIKGRQTKDELFCSQLAVEFNCLVWDVDYSLAPEYPFPTAVEESYELTAYAFAHAREYGVDAGRIVLMGHSAGGNLVATVCLRAGETQAFKPAAIVMEFCPMDLATDPATKPRAEGDMPAEVARTYNAFYCPAELANTPYVSPIFATEDQLAGFPDTLIMSAAKDSLCFEDEEFAMKLARAGVSVTSKRFQNSLHGFTINRNGDWEESQALLKNFVVRYIGYGAGNSTAAQLDHIAVESDDIDAVIRFFEEVFHMAPVRKTGVHPARKVWLQNGIQINEMADLETGKARYDHLALRVKDKTAILEKAKNYGCIEVEGKEFWIATADGLVIELM